MKLSAAIGSCLLLLVGCNDRQPTISKEDAARKRATETKINEIVAGNPGLKKACVEEEQAGEKPSMWWADNPDCFEMTQSRRWSGVWNVGFEWSNFCEGDVGNCPAFGQDSEVSTLRTKETSRAPDVGDGTYRVEFIGRRTKVPGHFGHLNQYEHFMVVDRWISVRRIRPSLK